jgi:hypothetical protein
MTGSTELVQVPCPQCGNVNRAARRRCRRSGPCGGTGLVTKTVPTAEAQARAITDAAFDTALDDARAEAEREQAIAQAAADMAKAMGCSLAAATEAVGYAMRSEAGAVADGLARAHEHVMEPARRYCLVCGLTEEYLRDGPGQADDGGDGG